MSKLKNNAPLERYKTMCWPHYRAMTFVVVLGVSTILSGMSFSEKREQLSQLNTGGDEAELRGIQDALQQKRDELNSLYAQLHEIMSTPSAEEKVPSENQLTKAHEIREKIVGIQKQITALENEWKGLAATELDEEFEGLWHHPDTTIGQLVIDYNPGDVVYIMPPDIANLKVHVSSRLSVPRASWKEVLEVVLSSSGVGIKPLSPFVKQLYALRVNPVSYTHLRRRRCHIWR